MANAAQVLDGKAVSTCLMDHIRLRIHREQLCPHLHVISLGEDPASKVYIRQKRLKAEEAGIIFSQTLLPLEATLYQLQIAIKTCNADSSIHGIIVQLPLPTALHSHEREVLNLIDPKKDVDCLHPVNFGHLAIDQPIFKPATPAGIVKLIQHYEIATKGKSCVILGKSEIVGKPLGLLLASETGLGATVTLCDKYTESVWNLTRQADIVVVAAGKHHLLNNPDWLREDKQAVVIDVGIHRVKTADGKVVVQGDVDADAVRDHCKYITPVPGGVGPMTVTCLLEQVVEAASRLAQQKRARVEKLEGIVSNSGCERISKEELTHLMQKLDSTFPAEALAQIFQTFHTDSNGCVSLHEFIGWACGGS